MVRRRRLTATVVVVVLLATGCAGDDDPTVAADAAGAATSTAPPTPVTEGAPVAVAAATTTTMTATTLPPTTVAPTTTTAVPRNVTDQPWLPLGTVGGVTVRHPSNLVERVGFHQSNHEGARQIEVADTAVAPVTLASRGRKSGSRSAADVVVHPATALRSPVSGTVLRAGSYTLYCDVTDDYVVIEPDGHPGWEVKVLHIDGVMVEPGDRVEAGLTVIAPRPTRLPFASQVDDDTANPSWPHVHLEVVDPSIPNEPNDGSGYEDC